MLNVWLSARDIKSRFPINSKVKIQWPGHAHDGVSGHVLGYNFYGKNRQYLLEVEMTFWTSLGRVILNIPWNRLDRV
jgi:hypothetical protein